MSSPTAISPDKLARLIGTANMPVLIDVRTDENLAAAGLLAASLGLSRMYDDDLEQLEAGIALYDAFYRRCRDATGETHNINKAKP